MKKVLCKLVGVALCATSAIAAGEGAYHNFKAAIYIAVGTTRELANPRTLNEQYNRIASQLRFDKVYLETYRNGQFAEDSSIEAIKKFFLERGRGPGRLRATGRLAGRAAQQLQGPDTGAFVRRICN
jgi:hypothetical protein